MRITKHSRIHCMFQLGITKARSKKIKEVLNGLIQEIWVDSNAEHSKLGPKEDECVINLIQAIEG